MALIFSPLTEHVLEGPFEPLPKHAFLMASSGKEVAAVDAEMIAVVKTRLNARRYKPITAADIRRTKDYLEKIVQTVRGCGFGVAIFSEYTPANTMGNIFFEVAHCTLLGKPVVLVKTDSVRVPSDFIRTEWVTHDTGDHEKLAGQLDHAIVEMRKLAGYYERLGDIARDAPEFDAELAFERYRQAFLINGASRPRKKIAAVRTRMAQSGPSRSASQRVERAMSEFMGML